MKTVEALGYSKTKAYASTGLEADIEMLKNATIAWKKIGSPLSGKPFNEFITSYCKAKKAVGGYIIVDPAADDTRQRPYTVINEVTDGKRKAKTFYQIKEAELKVKSKKIQAKDGSEKELLSVDVISAGIIAGKAERKEAAVKLMKELIEANKRNYAIEIGKEVVEGKRFASYGIYTPSKSAHQGKFIFFVNE